MKISIRGDKVEITEAIKNYVEEKLEKIDRYLDSPEEVEAKVLVRILKDGQKVEVTIPLKNFILRAEEKQDDVYAAVDVLVNNIERQIRKNKTKLQSQSIKNYKNERNFAMNVIEEIDDEDDDVVLEPVKKEKKKKEKKEKIKKEKPVKEEKEVKEIKIKEDNEVYDQNEKYIEAYIGEDYKLIKKSPFNIWAFLLNWMYFLYRKLYITGVVGLVITALVAFFLTKYFLIYMVVTLLVIGFGFNFYYVYIIKRRVNKILVDYEGSDSFSLEKMCKEFGGVNVMISLIIYLVFLIVIILSITKPTFNTSHNGKFFKENSENEANCSSLIRLTFQEEKTNYDKVEEAVCKVNKNKKNYELYLKTTKNKKTVYVYYETKNDYIVFKNNTEYLDILKNKKANKTITEEETKLLQKKKRI